VFDHADYDADGDVLYLHWSATARGRRRSPAKDTLFASRQGTQRIVGLTVINAR
jgi:hypothetical protein